jgi:hypothetical protein
VVTGHTLLSALRIVNDYTYCLREFVSSENCLDKSAASTRREDYDVALVLLT